MTSLVADSQGIVRGKFNIPPNVPSGNKLVVANGAGGSSGRAIFSGQGTVERRIWQAQTTTVVANFDSFPEPPPPQERGVDPLAQTFTLDSNQQISGVDLWFTDAPTTDVLVQIRETAVGFPTGVIRAQTTIPGASVVTGGTHTRVAFSSPVALLAGVEYAIVVLCNDAIGAVAVAELGKFDSNVQQWITSQPYTVGVLLSSSNASTWTAHQDRDMAFRLLRAGYTETTKVIDLGTVSVVNATDLLLMSYAERPASNTGVEYRLTMPDASILTMTDGQTIRLPAPVTGDIVVRAHIMGSANFSPVLFPGAQLVAGTLATSGDYVTRAVPAGINVSIKVIYEAALPSGASVTAKYRGSDAGDTWSADIPIASTRSVDDGFIEFVHELTGVTEDSIRVKLDLAGTSAARPRVRDLRVIVL